MSEQTRSVRMSWARILVVGLFGVMAGALLAPPVATAAVAAVQSVIVKNTSTSAVFVQPPGHTIVRFRLNGAVAHGHTDTSGVLYTVPAGHWVVITQVGFDGVGSGPVVDGVVDSSGTGGETGKTQIALPMSNAITRGSLCYQGFNEAGVWYFPPKSSIQYFLHRLAEDDSLGYNFQLNLSGYQTQAP